MKYFRVDVEAGAVWTLCMEEEDDGNRGDAPTKVFLM